MGNHPSNHIPLERNGVGKFGDAHTRRSLRSPRKMDRLRRSFRDSFRRRKDRVPESSKPHQWQADESAVRSGTCTFAVKYLGCVEVFDSRGMQVCEEALKVLRGSRRRPVRAVLHVSGDGLRVVEEDTKGLIVDQTIEKVSFCAPDRNHERGFSYICRDGTTRRWMCHGFLALRESGERLSHAVGCAFAVCLERKQKRDKECGVTMMFDAKNNTFTRTGSFRQQSITERDYNSEWAAKNFVVNTNNGSTLPVKSEAKSIGIDVGPNSATKSSTVNPFAIERPHATPSMLQRQGSCRGFSTLGENSPFKRQMSLRVNDLPSNAARLSQFTSPTSPTRNGSLTGDLRPAVSPIPEFAKSIRQWSMISGRVAGPRLFSWDIPFILFIEMVSPGDSVTALCQQLSQGLSQLTRSGSDDFNFNNSTINQNTLNLTLTTINNTYNQSITTTPMPAPTSATPVTLSFSPNFNRSTSSVTPSIASSVISNNVSSSNVTSSNNTSNVSNNLPKPEQWLGQIVKSTSPVLPLRMDGSSPRRPPSLGVHSRAVSLDSGAESFRPKVADPFDAEWAEIAARQNTNSTNPFLAPNVAPKAFQIQL